MYLGELTAAREHLEQAWMLYDPQTHGLSAVQGWVDPGVWCRAIALKGVAKDEVSEIRLIPASLKPLVVNTEFGGRVLA